METVFNHGITAEEWDFICGLDKDIYLKVVDENTARRDIAALYYHRGDLTTAEAYLNRLPPEVQSEFWRTVTHP